MADGEVDEKGQNGSADGEVGGRGQSEQAAAGLEQQLQQLHASGQEIVPSLDRAVSMAEAVAKKEAARQRAGEAADGESLFFVFWEKTLVLFKLKQPPAQAQEAASGNGKGAGEKKPPRKKPARASQAQSLLEALQSARQEVQELTAALAKAGARAGSSAAQAKQVTDELERLKAAAQTLESSRGEALEKSKEMEDKWMRARADVANVRREAERDLEQIRRFGAQPLAESLLDALDALDETAARVQDKGAETALGKGFVMAHGQLHKALAVSGLAAIKPAPGERLDPQRHQAMSKVTSEHPTDAVVRCQRGGYALHDRVIRPAMVTVSNGEGAAPAAAKAQPAAKPAAKPAAAKKPAAAPAAAKKRPAAKPAAPAAAGKRPSASEKPAASKKPAAKTAASKKPAAKTAASKKQSAAKPAAATPAAAGKRPAGSKKQPAAKPAPGKAGRTSSKKPTEK